MTRRIAARIRMLGRGGALMVALGVAMLAGEKTPAAAPNPYYKILNLGTFHASAYCSQAVCESHASDVNIWGQTVGWSRVGVLYPNTPFIRAFRTAPNVPITNLTALPLLNWCNQPHCDDYLSYRVNFAAAVNDTGWTVGKDCSFGHQNQLCDTPNIAFLVAGGPIQSLQVQPVTYGNNSSATGVNNYGAIVGTGSGGSWIGNSASLLPTSIWSPEDVSDYGIVVGKATSGRAFRWLGGPGIQDLGTLNPNCPTCKSIAYAINDPGLIVGASEFAAQLPGVYHAFIWPRLFSPPPMADLGTLCGGFNLCDSKALDINIQSHVVGTSETTGSGNGDPHAFLHKGSTMTDINTLLSPTDQAAWVLVDATGINDLGQIVGTGLFQHDKPRAYLLTPPLHFIFTAVINLPLHFSDDLVAEHQALGAILDAAETAVERGDLEDAHRQLDLYQDEVDRLVRLGRLGPLQATKLLAGIALIRREMEER